MASAVIGRRAQRVMGRSRHRRRRPLCTAADNRRYSEKGGVEGHTYRRAVVSGVSMEPTLYAGDEVVVRLGHSGITTGDVVVVGNTVHRLVWQDPFGAVWHCGDNPGVLPARTNKGRVSGRVVGVVRAGRWDRLPPVRRDRVDLVLLVVEAVLVRLRQRIPLVRRRELRRPSVNIVQDIPDGSKLSR